MTDSCASHPHEGVAPGRANPAHAGVANFRPDGVSREVIAAILDLARRAPSGVNTQPWNVFVLRGASRDALVELARSAVPALLSEADVQSRFWSQFKRLPGNNSWPGPAWERAGSDFVACANAAFGAGALRDVADLNQYFGLHGAPVALVCTTDRALGLGSVLDCGMFLQTIAAAAADRGLTTEVQTGWKGLGDAVLANLDAPCGALMLAVMALGHAAPPAAGSGPSVQPKSVTLWHT